MKGNATCRYCRHKIYNWQRMRFESTRLGFAEARPVHYRCLRKSARRQKRIVGLLMKEFGCSEKAAVVVLAYANRRIEA